MHHNPYADSHDMILAHMSPSEVRELAETQGGIEYDPHTKYASFKKLGEYLQHPHVKQALIEWEGNRFAGGGEVEGLNEFLRKSGRYGDTEMVHLPRPLADLFDRALSGGKPSINPRTGHREYFLGGLFGGLSKVFNPIKNFATSAFNTIKPVAGSVLQHFAPMAGALAGQGLSAASERFGGGPLGADLAQQFGNTVGHMAGKIGSSWENNGNVNPQEAAANTAAHFGSYAIPRMAGAAQNYAQNRAANIQNPYVSAMLNHGAGAGASMMNQMGEAGINALSTGQTPNFARAANTGAANYFGGIEHPIAQTMSRTLGSYA